MSLMEVKDLSYGYSEELLFKNVNVSINEGEHIGLVGSNGVGKSTFLKLLKGKLIPDNGSISKHSKCNVGYLEQHIDPREGITIREFLSSAFDWLYKLEVKINNCISEISNTNDNKEIEKLLSIYSDGLEILETQEFYEIDNKIEKVANGLGITSLGMDTEVKKLSGGQKTKVLLAKLLLEKPNLLLLDEPTNHLDFSHIEWLANHLKSYDYTFILISHNSYFLKETTNTILHIDQSNILKHNVAYHQFLVDYKKYKERIKSLYKKQQEEIKRMETFIEKNRARVSKSKQAKSREKKLSKMDKIEKPKENFKPDIYFNISKKRGKNELLLEATNLSVGYRKPLFPKINKITLRFGEKAAITGYNGIGKSTTLKTLLGKVKPLGGDIEVKKDIDIGYFSQDFNIESSTSPLAFLTYEYPNKSEKEIRQKLAQLGINKDKVNRPLKTLSGGEQSKVRLAFLTLKETEVLILDEPTNHLDSTMKECLKNALKKYQGSILLVSHEPNFYSQIVDKIINIEDIIGRDNYS